MLIERAMTEDKAAIEVFGEIVQLQTAQIQGDRLVPASALLPVVAEDGDQAEEAAFQARPCLQYPGFIGFAFEKMALIEAQCLFRQSHGCEIRADGVAAAV